MKVEINEFFGWWSWQIIWMKILIGWNAWMELILKQLFWMKTTSTWMKVTKWINFFDESWTSMNFLYDDYKLTNHLDEKFDRLKCMDGINSKTIILNENHIYMDES
jgi:hypothetical protein